MYKDLKQYSFSTPGFPHPSEVQLCLKPFTEAAACLHLVKLIHATGVPERQSHMPITSPSPQEAYIRTILVKSSRLNVSSCSSPPVCHLHLSLHLFSRVWHQHAQPHHRNNEQNQRQADCKAVGRHLEWSSGRGEPVSLCSLRLGDVTHVSDGEGRQASTWSIRIISQDVRLQGHRTDRQSFRKHSTPLLSEVHKRPPSGLGRRLSR